MIERRLVGAALTAPIPLGGRSEIEALYDGPRSASAATVRLP
jgi:hypothetical protein